MHSARAFANQYRQTGASSAILDASMTPPATRRHINDVWLFDM